MDREKATSHNLAVPPCPSLWAPGGDVPSPHSPLAAQKLEIEPREGIRANVQARPILDAPASVYGGGRKRSLAAILQNLSLDALCGRAPLRVSGRMCGSGMKMVRSNMLIF